MFYKKGSKTPQNLQSEIELTTVKPLDHADLLQSIIMTHQKAVIPMLLVNSGNFKPSDDLKQLLESITSTQETMIKKLLMANTAALNKNAEVHHKILEEHWMQNEKSYLTQQQIGQLTYGKNF